MNRDIQARYIDEKAPCPCGSGQDHSHCCLKKGIHYGVFELGDRKVVFDVGKAERSIESLLRFVSRHQGNPSNAGNGLDIEDALLKLHQIYQLFAASIAPFSRVSSCGRGCNACCRHIIETTPLEAEAVRRFVERHFDDFQKTRLLSQIERYKSCYPPYLKSDEEHHGDLQNQYFQKHIPCPFLSTDGSCMVYEARPFVCRTYIVFSDPELCRKGEEMAVYEGAYFSQVHGAAQILSLRAFTGVQIRRHLPDWFIHELKL